MVKEDGIGFVCYEELATIPERVVKELGSYLKLDRGSFDLSRIRASSIRRYGDGLTAEELNDVVEFAEERMVRCGCVP